MPSNPPVPPLNTGSSAGGHPSPQSPRNGAFAGSPGSYQPAVRLYPAVLNAGETVTVEVFISGYGEIGGAKLLVYPSPGVFDTQTVNSWCGFKLEDGTITFGGNAGGMDDAGCMFELTGGMKAAGWPTYTLFVDHIPGVLPQILTETIQKKPPILMKLPVRLGCRPGTYSLQFLLTYFNGSTWQTATQNVEFTIQTIIQRYDKLIAIVAALAAGSEILLNLHEIVMGMAAVVRRIIGL